jgi:predicted phosphodiesterase
MNIAKICEHFISGKTNREIAQILIDAGEEESMDNTRKGVGFLRKRIENGNSAEALLLTRENRNGKGETTSQTFTRRAIQDEPIPDHLQVDALTTSPTGGKWVKYKSTVDVDFHLKEKERIQALIAELKTGFSKAKTAEAKGSGIGVIAMADFHYGMKYEGDIKNAPFSIESLTQSVRDAADKINKMGLEEVHLALLGDFIESFTGLNHMDAWKHLESYGRDAVVGVSELLRDELLLRVNNVAAVYMIAGNHDRISVKSDIDSKGEAAKLVADFLGLMVDVPIHFDYSILNPTIDGIKYILTHGHLGLSKMEEHAAILEFGDQNIYNVILNAHGHHKKMTQGHRARRDLKTNVVSLEGSNFIKMQIAPMVTGGSYSNSIGGYSTSGYSAFRNNGKGELDYYCLAA